MLKLSQLNAPHGGGILGPSYGELKRDVIDLMEMILDENQIPYKHHKTEHWIQLPWSPGKIYFFTGDRKLRGPNLAYFGINEATLITEERYKECIGRVRIAGSKFPQIASVGTPEGIGNFMYERFVENPKPNSRIIYGNTTDNAANLSSDYVQSLLESYDQVMVDAYLKGLWINMNSHRFYYSYDPSRHDDKTITRIPGMPVLVTMDFNVSPMCATLWHQIKIIGSPFPKLIAFGQIEIKDGADTEKMSDAMYANGLDPDSTYIYPDPAGKARSTQGPPDITILKNHGWKNIRVKLSAPRFRKRQLAVNNLLDKDLIGVNPITAPGIKKDFEAVSQDPATFEKLKDNPKLTHYSDGVDYLVDIEYPLSGEKPQSSTTKFR
ncbi:MAG: hypothetical protein IPP74_15530 [Alphaproteobacteria bacterium]|nr:hypothetical protein [Alphaproteobacteria bacterium]